MVAVAEGAALGRQQQTVWVSGALSAVARVCAWRGVVVCDSRVVSEYISPQKDLRFPDPAPCQILKIVGFRSSSQLLNSFRSLAMFASVSVVGRELRNKNIQDKQNREQHLKSGKNCNL